MAKLKTQLSLEEQHQKDLEQLANYRPLDDDFMVRQEVAIRIA